MKRLQHPSLMLCGECCIFFSLHICREMKLYEMISLFDNELRLIDRMVTEFGEHYHGCQISSLPCTSDCQSGKKSHDLPISCLIFNHELKIKYIYCESICLLYFLLK